MPEKLKELLDKIVNWWKALTIRQRTIIITVSSVILLAFVLLVTLLTRPQYSLLANCETAKEGSQIKTLLDEENITNRVSTDGTRIEVLTSQLSDANLLLAANDIVATSYSIDNVTSGGFSTTESDKKKRYKLYLESHLENDFIKKFSAIKSCNVQLNIPDDNGTLIAQSQESYATIGLELQGEFTEENARFLARAVATALGNDDTSNITIIDYDGKMLFSGAEEDSIVGGAGSQLTVRQQQESYVASAVKRVLENTNGFDTIEVAPSLELDFSVEKETHHDYTPAEGQKQGVLAEQDTIDTSSVNSSGGIPGTDSNASDDTYVLQDYGQQQSSSSEVNSKYLPNESITEKNKAPGRIDKAKSYVSVTAIDYTIIKQEDAKKQGLLDGISWEEYKAQNSDRTKMEIDEDYITAISNATGIPEANISLLAFQQNWFVDSEGLGIGTTDLIVIILIVLILGLLAFVILRSMMRERKNAPQEEELSVESLLQSAPEEPMIDAIETESKSETRMMIEKFVEENPEAAANLLRNWLEEDWG